MTDSAIATCDLTAMGEALTEKGSNFNPPITGGLFYQFLGEWNESMHGNRTDGGDTCMKSECEVATYVRDLLYAYVKANNNSKLLTKFELAMYSAGILGYLVLLWILRRLKGPSYIYHRAIAVLELFGCAIGLAAAILQTVKPEPSQLSKADAYYLLIYSPCILSAVAASSNSITAGASLERLVALCFPTYFACFNKTSVAVPIVIVSILVNLIQFNNALAQTIVLMNSSEAYGADFTPYMESPAYNIILNLILAYDTTLRVVIVILALMIMVALLSRAAKSLKLQRNMNSGTFTGVFQSDIRLSLLVLSIALPIGIYQLSAIIEYALRTDSIFQLDKCFSDAMANVSKFHEFLVADFVKNIMFLVDRTGNFFFYYAFNHNVRKTLHNSLSQRKSRDSNQFRSHRAESRQQFEMSARSIRTSEHVPCLRTHQPPINSQHHLEL